jgi:hypothetical protein
MLDPDFFLRCLAPAGAIAIGAAIGSFLNVCIYRIPNGLTVTKPTRSFCPSCRDQIKAIDNIPVISWLLLKVAAVPAWRQFRSGISWANCSRRSGQELLV